jgi:hypothetical protein
MLAASLVLAVVTPRAVRAGDLPPLGTINDKYVKVLAGKPLVEGKGFPGLLVVGAPLPTVVPLLDWGREEPTGFPFWYFYEKGPWKLTVIAARDRERCWSALYRIEALVVEGAGAPATSRGLHVGDPRARVTELYGAKTTPFEGPIDHRGSTRDKPVMWGGGTPDMSAREAYDEELKAGAYYPELGLIVTFLDDKVAKMIAFFEYPPLPLWLRPTPDTQNVYIARIEPGRSVPALENPDAPWGTILVPPPPPLEKAVIEGVTLSVPKGWAREGSFVRSPLGPEQIVVTVHTAEPGATAEAWFEGERDATENRNLPKVQERLPAAFVTSLGADAGFATDFEQDKAGIGGLARRSYVLFLAKGARRVRIEVSRTAGSRQPSPDGIEMARQILTSVRLAK